MGAHKPGKQVLAIREARGSAALRITLPRDRQPGPKLVGAIAVAPAWAPVAIDATGAPANLPAGGGFRADRPTIVQLPSCGPPASFVA